MSASKTYIISSIFCFLMLTQLVIISLAPTLAESSHSILIDMEDSAEREEGDKGEEGLTKVYFQQVIHADQQAHQHQLSVLGRAYELSLRFKLIPLTIITPPPELVV